MIKNLDKYNLIKICFNSMNLNTKNWIKDVIMWKYYES